MDKLKTVNPIITQDTKFCHILFNISNDNTYAQIYTPLYLEDSSEDRKKVKSVPKCSASD